MLFSETHDHFRHTPVEGRSDGARGVRQNSPCVAPEVQQRISETRIQSKAVPTLHTFGLGPLSTHVSNPVPRASIIHIYDVQSCY